MPSEPTADVVQRWTQVDRAFAARLDDPAVGDRWLLLQGLALGVSRRTLLGSLGIGASSTILDIGTGYGNEAIDLAVMGDFDVLGVDIDPKKLTIAEAVAEEAASKGLLHPAARVRFTVGDIRHLDHPDGSCDGAIMRFVLEYLPDPDTVLEELFRLVRPGGFCCIIDVDDTLSITYPVGSSALDTLRTAFAKQQEAAGTDRHIGRKLPGLLDRGGFDVVAVALVPQAHYGSSMPGDPERGYLVERFRRLRGDFVAHGGLDEATFDAALESLQSEVTHGVCSIEAHVAAVGRRRP